MGLKRYTLSVDVTRADHDTGIWIAHCLDLDVYFEAGSVTAALRGITEMAQDVIEFDLSVGASPNARSAPEADWQRFRKVRSEAKDVGVIDLDTYKPGKRLRTLVLTMFLDVHDATEDAAEVAPALPPAWFAAHAVTTGAHHKAVIH